MARKKATFSWRTAPRSIQVLISWLPYFSKFQGESWTGKKDNIYQLRRKLRWTYEYDKDEPDEQVVNVPFSDFIIGEQIGRVDKESLVRQQFTTAEQFGFLGTKGSDNSLFVTEAGRRIVDNTFTPEDFLVQLIKMYVITNKDEEGVFPFKVFIDLLKHFNYLSRYELAYMFGVTTPSKFKQAQHAITAFRKNYNDRAVIPMKNDNKRVEVLHKRIWEEHFGEDTFLTSWNDYTDAFLRAVIYTDMFSTSGRSFHTKVRVKDIFQSKFDLLTSGKYEFEKPPKKIIVKKKETFVEEVASRDDLNWFGAVGNISLPWDNFNERKELVKATLEKVSNEFNSFDNDILTEDEMLSYAEKVQTTSSIHVLKDVEAELSSKLMIRNIEHFIQVVSKTKEAKEEIIERFHTILNDNDMSALWLEVNTWKSLVSLEGEKEVIPNFKMEEDLTPRSFAPGIGNTPDMELYTDNYVIIPEVSLMTGKVQWEHEGSSVIDHVLSIAEQHEEKDTIGLFLSSSINHRTLWQFFVLAKTSWVGRPVPVIPLTINQYTDVINHLYQSEGTIDDLYNLLKKCSEKALELNDYEDWEAVISDAIDELPSVSV